MEQRQQIVYLFRIMPALTSYRGLPPGFLSLRPDLGTILRARRKQGGYGKQATVASQVGIAPETLSRIENNKAVPRLETLDALLVALELGWDEIAERDHDWVADDNVMLSRRRDRMLDAGSDLQEARARLGMTLREVAALSGLSLAQLSRVESGQSGGPRVYDTHPEDEALPRDERRLIFSNPVLADLVSRPHEAED